MKRRTLIALVLTASLLGSMALYGSSRETAVESSAEEATTADSGTLPGVELAKTLATATGIAITPLLGVSAVGAWEYYHADPAARTGLPWYTARWFWLPGLVVALLLVFKDPLLGLVPGAKKPLDAVDVLENKASALLAAPAVVPMFVGAFTVAGAARVALGAGLGTGLGTESLTVSQAGIAAMPGFVQDLPQALGIGIGAGIFLVAFFCIWLAFHAINVLILLSPFGPLDFLLRSIKLFVLLVLIGSTFIHPYLGVAVALLILLAAIPLAGWSFRLMVFGGVMATDLTLRRHRKSEPDAARLRVFTAERVGSARARTYGRVSLESEAMVFSYRPWLVFPRKSATLSGGPFRLGRGLVCPILYVHEEDGGTTSVLRFPPRYRTHEETLAATLSLGAVEDRPLRRGLKACFAWLKEMAGKGGEAAVELAGKARIAVS